MPDADTNSYRNRFMMIFKRQFAATAVAVTKTISQTNPDVTGVANSNATGTNGISLYPNPVVAGGIAMIKFSNIEKGNYDISVYNQTGQKLSGNKITHNGINNIYPVTINPLWMQGVYTMTIENTGLINSKQNHNARTCLSFLITKN